MAEGIPAQIRNARESDAPAIARFIMMAEGDMVYRMFNTEEVAKAEKALVPLILSPLPCRYSLDNTLIADVDGTPAGAIIAFPADRQAALDEPLLEALNRHGHRLARLYREGVPGTYYLSSMGVDSAFRGHGLGTSLMAAAEEDGAGRGFDRASLLVAKNKNRVRGMYNRLGYQDLDEANIVGTEYWRMVKSL